MTSDDIELLAYVDGLLSTREREAVERRLARSADAASRVERLGASRLPYAQAFAHQRLPPVPTSLERMVEGIARASSLAIKRRALNKIAPGWLAAAFCAGMLICGALSNAAIRSRGASCAKHGRMPRRPPMLKSHRMTE